MVVNRLPKGTPDRRAKRTPGDILLFDLARGLSDLGLDIASAHIATFGEKAVDVFYVRDRFRKKLASGDAKRLIRKRLLALLDAG